MLRLLKLGAFDFASFDIAKVGGRRSKIRRLRPLRPRPYVRDSHKACDAWRASVDKLMQRSGTRSCSPSDRAPAGALVRTEVKSFRGSKGQEAARLHEDDGRFRERHRRGAGQYRVPRSCDRASEQGRGLRRHRHRGRKFGWLDRSDQIPDADFARLGDQRSRRQSQHLEAPRSEGAGLP